MSEIKLKPCPFCGGEAHKRVGFPLDPDGLEMNMYVVGCKTCDIEFTWLWDEKIAIELWNTRKPMENVIEEITRRDTTDGTVKVFSGKEVIDIIERGGVE